MILDIVLLALFMLAPTFFAWAAIHELSHIAAVKMTVGARSFVLDLWPRFDRKNRTFYWARSAYEVAREPSKEEAILIHLSPRLSDLVAVVLLPLVPVWVSSPLGVAAISTFLLGGVIDGMVGSIGWSEHSDLKRACQSDFGRWTLRIAGWTFCVASIVFWFCLL